MKLVKPVLQALLLADHVYTDALTGKKIVAGIFHQMFFTKDAPGETRQEGDETTVIVPVNPSGYRAGSPFCYISLTDVHGDQDFELRYVDLRDDQQLMATKFRVQSPDPVQVVELAIPLLLLPADRAGTFALELLWNSEPLGSHRIIVSELKKEEDKQDGN